MSHGDVWRSADNQFCEVKMDVLYSLRPEILVLKMDKMDVSITKISLDTTISRTSISGRREY